MAACYDSILVLGSWIRNRVVPHLSGYAATWSMDCLRPDSPSSQWVVSVVIPCLNEEETISATIESCVQRADKPSLLEIIVVVCAGTTDNTSAAAKAAAARVQKRVLLFESGHGRGAPLRLGGDKARGDIIVFLHADVILPHDWDKGLRRTAADPLVLAGAFRFGVAPSSPGTIGFFETVAMWVMEKSTDWRFRLFGVMEGDHAPWAFRQAYHAMGGFPSWPLLEDLEFQRRAWRLAATSGGRIRIVPQQTLASPRAWIHMGVARRELMFSYVYTMFYVFGASPYMLYEMYYRRKFVGDGCCSEE